MKNWKYETNTKDVSLYFIPGKAYRLRPPDDMKKKNFDLFQSIFLDTMRNLLICISSFLYNWTGTTAGIPVQ